MATLDYTLGGSSTSTARQWSDVKNNFVISVRLKVSEIIAADTTMTANGYIATSDVIQCINWPSRCMPLYSIHETITAGTASATMDIGLAGGQELDAGVACDATAGTVVVGSVADGSIDDFFAGADTIDVEVLVANLAAGDYRLHVPGVRMEAIGTRT